MASQVSDIPPQTTEETLPIPASRIPEVLRRLRAILSSGSMPEAEMVAKCREVLKIGQDLPGMPPELLATADYSLYQRPTATGPKWTYALKSRPGRTEADLRKLLQEVGTPRPEPAPIAERRSALAAAIMRGLVRVATTAITSSAAGSH